MSNIEFLRSKGYPRVIIGNDGYRAYLIGLQPLTNGDYEAIYRYPGGECCHDLETIKKHFEIVEW